MNTQNHRYLALSWSVSRGRDTDGYNICRLDDNTTGKRYKCMGGGYDMVGTVVAQFLQDAYQDRLVAIADKFASRYNKAEGFKSGKSGFYGGCFHSDENRVSLDGACGISSIIHIAEAIGVNITSNYNRRKNRTDGYFVSENCE